MRFYNTSHLYYCGIDLHAKSMYLCVLDQEGKTLLHRNFPTQPEIFLKAIAPFAKTSSSQSSASSLGIGSPTFVPARVSPSYSVMLCT